MNTEHLYIENRNKTRVLVISKYAEITELIITSLKFNRKSIDYLLENGKSESNTSDFFLLERINVENAENFHPNIALIASENLTQSLSPLLNSITDGGIVVYNESDEAIRLAVASSEKYFRKIPFQMANITENSIETDFGYVPLPFVNMGAAKFTEGAKLLCQHLGIMEEAFYEGLATLS